jgi:hypothetical protein
MQRRTNTVSVRMDIHGVSCFPTIRTLAGDVGMSLSSGALGRKRAIANRRSDAEARRSRIAERVASAPSSANELVTWFRSQEPPELFSKRTIERDLHHLAERRLARPIGQRRSKHRRWAAR